MGRFRPIPWMIFRCVGVSMVRHAQLALLNHHFDMPSRREVRPANLENLKVTPRVLGFERCGTYAAFEDDFAGGLKRDWLTGGKPLVPDISS